MVVLAVVALLVVLVGGAYLILKFGPAGTVIGVDWVVILTVAWFFLVSAAVARVTARRPELRVPLRAAFLTVAIAGAGFYLWDTYLRPKKEMNEEIVQVQPPQDAQAPDRPRGDRNRDRDGGSAATRNRLLGSGSFTGADGHDASGKASLVQLAGGDQVVTFEDFEVDQGPDLRVYLVQGESVSGDNYIDLGKLKAEKGQFQYKLDQKVDPDEYTHVHVWCRAFSVRMGYAPIGQS